MRQAGASPCAVAARAVGSITRHGGVIAVATPREALGMGRQHLQSELHRVRRLPATLWCLLGEVALHCASGESEPLCRGRRSKARDPQQFAQVSWKRIMPVGIRCLDASRPPSSRGSVDCANEWTVFVSHGSPFQVPRLWSVARARRAAVTVRFWQEFLVAIEMLTVITPPFLGVRVVGGPLKAWPDCLACLGRG